MSNQLNTALYDHISNAADPWLEMACREAAESVKNGGGPFGAVIVQYDAEFSTPLRHWTGQNRVVGDCDPTAHAEITAIRAACRELGTHSLGRILVGQSKLPQPDEESYCVIYASCEPCPMCYCAIRWAGLCRLTFAATRFDAAAPGIGFSDQVFYDELSLPYARRPIMVRRAETPLAKLAFEQWQKSNNPSY